MLKIYPAKTNEDIDIAKHLFFEYLEYLKTEFYEYADMAWFIEYYQRFEKEINNLPGEYQPPKGCILLATYNNEPVGCVALDEQSDGICEMKRLYIKPEYHRRGIGTVLCRALIDKATTLRYTNMRLATALETPKYLYKSLGFTETAPFDHVPLDSVVFMELKLV